MSEPNREAWEALVAYAYEGDKDGARVVQQVTAHYLEMRERLAHYETLHPASEWTEADGPVPGGRTSRTASGSGLQSTLRPMGN